MAKYMLVSAIMGRSQREYNWKVKALKEILRETRGINLPIQFRPKESQLKFMRFMLKFIDDPLKLMRRFPFLQNIIHKLPLAPEVRRKSISDLFWLLLRNAINTQGNFRPSQAMFTSLGAMDTWDLGIRQSEWIAEKKKEYIKKGLFLDDGGDLGCGGTFENAHMGYLEGIGLYSAKDPNSIIAAGKIINEAVQACIDKAFGIPIAGFGQEMNAKLGPYCNNYHLWLARIKKALDTNCVSDPFFYAEPAENPTAKDEEKDNL